MTGAVHCGRTYLVPLVSRPGQQQPCDPRLDTMLTSVQDMDIWSTRLLPGARQGSGQGLVGEKKGCVAR